MGAAMGYALRRTSARVVLLIGVGGLLWMVLVAQPYYVPVGIGKGARPTPISRGSYRVLGSGFSPWEVAAALVAVVAVVAAAVVYRERSSR
jgi:hypothetical protein